MKTWERKLGLIQGKFDREVSSLATKFRREVLKPLCKQHGLSFTSGMGTFFFSKGDINVGSSPHGEAEWQIYVDCNLKPVLDVLDLEVSHNQVFGYYVADVKEAARVKLHRTPKDSHQ